MSTEQNPFLSTGAIAFLTVSQTKNFSKAGKQLGISQSAISQSIALFEKQLGIELFDRSTRPLRLTKDAEVLYDELNKKNTDLKIILQLLRSQNFVRSSIRVGIVDSLALNIGAEFIKKLLDRGYRPAIHSGSSDTLYQKLLLDELDVIIATEEFHSSQQLEKRFLFKEPNIVILPSSIASQKKKWTWNDLKFCGLPLIRYTTNTASGLQNELLLSKLHLELPTLFAADDNQLLLSLVSKEMGWIISQPLVALSFIRKINNLTIIEMPSPRFERKLYTIRKKQTSTLLIDDVEAAARSCILSNTIPQIEELMPWSKEFDFT